MYQESSTVPLFVAIDIGKNVHFFGGFAGQEPAAVDAIQEVTSNRFGYDQFRSWLSAQLGQGRYNPVVVGLEPTSTYHEPWAYAIQADYGDMIDFRFLNPYQTKQKRKQLKNGRRRKTDPTDVAAIAYCLRDGLGQPARLPRHTAFDFSVWAAAYRRMHREQQRLRVNLSSQIDRLWPGALVNVKAFQKAHPDLPVPRPLVLSNPLERQRVQILLQHAPDPHHWKGCSLADIQAFFHSHGLRCGPVTAQKLHDIVHYALLLPPDLTEPLSRRLQADLARFQMLRDERDALKQAAESLVPSSPAAVLTTVPGIASFLAAQYLAYVVDARRFRYAEQIWSLAGFDPAQEESGDWRRVGKITRRGNPGLRHVLFTIGLNTSQHCPAIARAKARAQQAGKGPVGAVIHAASKANRMCFRLLRDQVAYDPKLMR